MRLPSHRAVAQRARACPKADSGSGGFGEAHRHSRDAVAHDGVVAAVAGGPAALPLFLDVADLAAGRHLTVASNDAAARESGEAEKSNETHSEPREQVSYR